MKSSKPPKFFCGIFILAVVSFFLTIFIPGFAFVFVGLVFAGILFIFMMVCKTSRHSYHKSWLDLESETELTLLEKVDGLKVVFPEKCPECGYVIEMNHVHIVDELTIMCPNCLTRIKGVLNE